MFVEHKEAMEVTEAPAKVLKLSEAIRIGAKIRPQCKAAVFKRGASCAWGAAAEALGMPYRDGWLGTAAAMRFVADRLGLPGSFIDNETNWDTAKTVWGRSDHYGTREQVADWLEAKGY